MVADLVIAIDGPAGSGKSTVAKNAAVELGLNYLDTGAMYRAVAWYVIQQNVSPEDHTAVKALLHNLNIDINTTSKGINLVYCNNEEITERIRKPSVSKVVSQVAENSYVREFLTDKQRKLGKKGAVIDGRDIGTRIFPDADFKFFLTASFETRVLRRWQENINKGYNVKIADVKREIRQRDALDKTRSLGPLKKAKDAINIDSTYMTVDQVTSKIVTYIKQNYCK